MPVYCPKCKSRIYPADQPYLDATGVCSYCVTYDRSPDKHYQTAWKKAQESAKTTPPKPKRTR